VEGISKKVRRSGYHFSSLIKGVVESVPFQERRGEARRTVAMGMGAED